MINFNKIVLTVTKGIFMVFKLCPISSSSSVSVSGSGIEIKFMVLTCGQQCNFFKMVSSESVLLVCDGEELGLSVDILVVGDEGSGCVCCL